MFIIARKLFPLVALVLLAPRHSIGQEHSKGITNDGASPKNSSWELPEDDPVEGTDTDILWGGADTPTLMRIEALGPNPSREARAKFIANEKALYALNFNTDALLPATEFGTTPQVVFVDFDSQTGPGEYVYTPDDRAFIVARILESYAFFNTEVVLTQPTSGDFSTLTYNDGPTGGIASNIDFLNQDRSDSATVDVNDFDFGTQAEIVLASANIGAHELGHIFGLRHGDSFGAPGDGLPDTGEPGPSDYNPLYPGPQSASEATIHNMASPASVGQTLTQISTITTFLDERSAIKLSMACGKGTILPETEAKALSTTGAGIEIPELLIPNTLTMGQNAGSDLLSVDAFVVIGSISTGTELDEYRLQLQAGRFITAELVSIADDNIMSFDSTLTLLREETSGPDTVVYFNGDEFESFDSIIIDHPIASDATYKLTVNSIGSQTGDYKLLIYVYDQPMIQGMTAPDNDLCEDAIDLGTLTNTGPPLNPIGTTVGATIDDGFDTPCSTSGDDTITAPGVWYTFQSDLPCLSASTCFGATNYDSKISVYAGDDCGNLDCVEGNDDGPGACGLPSFTGPFPGETMTTYYVLVHGFGAGEGDFSLVISESSGCTTSTTTTSTTSTTTSTKSTKSSKSNKSSKSSKSSKSTKIGHY